ncbi:MAG: hypothetical protein ACLPXB_03175 [Thiobacillaceae bacterium]
MNPETEAKSSTQLIDWVALYNRFDNRQEFIDRSLRVTYASHIDMLGKLHAVILGRGLEAIAYTAHALRGTAGKLEAQKMRNWATETEESARAGRPEAGRVSLSAICRPNCWAFFAVVLYDLSPF